MILAHSREESAAFLAEILGLEVGEPGGPWLPIEVSNGVTLLFASAPPERISVGHYAVLVSDEEFDQIFARVEAKGLTYWADPQRRQEMEINHHHGGRGFYFLDPAGHGMEVLTRAG